MPFGDDLLQFRLRRRPQIRADEAGRIRGARRPRVRARARCRSARASPPDPGALSADAGIAAEVRAVHVLDRELVLLREGEEVEGSTVQPCFQLGGDARAREIEEADVVRRRPEIVAETSRSVRAFVELGQVEDREREFSHGPRVCRLSEREGHCCAALPPGRRLPVATVFRQDSAAMLESRR